MGVHAATPTTFALYGRSLVSSSPASSLDVGALVREHAPYVGRVLRYLGVPEHDLDDVAQEVFVVVLRKHETFEHRASWKTWLYSICVRVARDERGRAHRRREVPTDAPPAESYEPPTDPNAQRTLLLSLLSKLDEDKRAVIVLHEVEELPLREIAEVLGVPLQTAYSRLSAARAALNREAERLRKRGIAP